MSTANEVLKKYWGYDSFRPLQGEIIDALTNGKHVLALMPTGGGKSLCFQVPALMQKGLTIVISPLIALMKDQVQNLKKRGIKAEAIVSGMHPKEIQNAFDRCIYGNVKLLYVSPERLHTELFQERLKKMSIQFIAIDEAHCISQWGYDFRPAYLQIPIIRQYLPNVPFIALTATATEMVKKDIVEKLGLKEVSIFQKSFERQNLSYSVLYVEDKINKMLEILNKVSGTGIVYVRSRKGTQDVAAFLKKNGVKADYYHGGLNTNDRSKKQDSWINDKIRIMVCTNAFGMGIDKPDVRIVIHLGLPESLEAYFQEAGRGGRDGHKAYAVLLYHPSDGMDLLSNFKRNMPDIPTIKNVYHSLGNYFRIAYGSGGGRAFDFDIVEFCKKFNQRGVIVYHSLQTLEREGYFSLSDGVLIPSKVYFLSKHPNIYSFQTTHVQYHPIIQLMLRSYEGIMDDFCKINEERLAQNLSISITDVEELLKGLESYEIIKYSPRSDKPQITYITERIVKDHLYLNPKRFYFRRKVIEDNLKAVVNYAETKHICRSQQLLFYFAENNALPCGTCDVCLNHQTAPNTLEESNIESLIEYHLSNSVLFLNELIQRLPQITPEYLILIVRQMMEEGAIKVGADERMEWVG